MKFRAAGDLIVGIIIGIMAQMPGASGATVAVIFKVYERLISDVADIRNKLLKDLKFMIPIGIGGLTGYFVCALALGSVIDQFYVPLLFFFGMLILVQIPDIKRMSDDGSKPTRNNVLALVCGVAAIIAVFAIKTLFAGDGEIEAGYILMFVAGLIVIASMLSPGISGSTILLALGIYPAFLAAISEFNLKLLLPLALGMIVGLLVFSRVINYFMKNCRKSTYFAILGLSAGSVLVVLAEAVMKLVDKFEADVLLLSAACAVLGAICGYVMCRLARKYLP